MNKKVLAGWLDDFLRQAKLRRGIVLSGNVIDLAFSAQNSILPMREVLDSSLKQAGFKHVVFYSRVGGISGVTVQDWQNLQSQLQSSTDELEGDDYDLGEDFGSETETLNPTTEVTPEDFFAMAQRVMLDHNAVKTAFIIDWSNYLFGQVNALSEQERGWLLQISQGLRNARDAVTASEVDKVQSLMVFMCQGASILPPSLYLGNPQFAEVNIPLPNRESRKQAIMSLAHVFDVDETLSSGSRALEDLTDLTDALTLRDINHLARLSRQQEGLLSIDALVSLYRYGKKESPWEQLNRDKLKTTTETLSRRVKGQQEAIETVKKVLIRAYTGLAGLQHSSRSRTPKGALFFVGPTGVGKTELAKSLASFLFGDEDACLRFDMSEFNHEHADQRLVGAPPGYVGFEEGGQLTNAVKRRPFSLLLFDEIEKAHPRILDKFLQILEDGRLTDGKGETVMFSDTFIVFTSNIGASTIQPGHNTAEAFKSAVSHHFVNELKRPELLGRIGEANIVPFNFMQDREFLVSIAKTKLEPLKNRLKEKWLISDLVFENEDQALSTIIDKVNPQSGGRGVLNALVSSLFDPLAQFLFEEVDDANALAGKTISVVQAGKSFDFDILQ
ncbi:AAA family ATPase [Vibrio parahaemolyticus]|uniref:AAA family ATPase n=1 Tax=Vibrio parahaemolyticus TaxID=670 RepID=UPI00041D8FA1|nr:AAA family ATPase [Vibrio parahaemolyticus]EGR1752056.1 ATP-dependent Clp protease ATP-binding subunit [Vibrio parahaemolyticus]EME0901453.1 ATP-dependent Clp protease ATP-binding subunit [Vibrio parahaemolyticus]MBE5152680.1 ATP-dependent Clp protease ATP-binding subunit [Vibrio parahaemolyticus]MBE5161095.1 ATP-dependent Clp protease ATP-binding subunit [Vibrio parahaemolyticus]MCG0018477.1 AAA family ATPase [Vibrio parahaemolyticus]